MGSFIVTEGRDRVGGNVTSLEDEERGFLWEEGPNSFQPNDSMLKVGCQLSMMMGTRHVDDMASCPQVAVDAGIDKDLVFGDPKAPRFVYWDKKLRATPSGPDALTFDLLSIWGKIRAGLGAIGLKPAAPGRQCVVGSTIALCRVVV